MPSPEYDDIRNIKDFKSLIKYLRKDLNWPVDEEQVDDLTFDYKAAELGIDDTKAVKIKEIKQLRPLTGNQPWGVFWIQFEQKQLPVVVMRRILSALVRKERGQRGRKGNQKTWDLPDLMFISATGAGNERGISFAHFQYSPLPAGEGPGVRSQLRTFAWDVKETHLYYIKNLNLNALRWPVDARNVDAWRRQWGEAFTVAHREVPRTAEMLANKMAQIASYIREAVELTYSMEHAGGSLHQLHLNLKLDLISDLTEDDFADMYAQTVTYGLFAARATRSGDFSAPLSPAGRSETGPGVRSLIEHTNPFLRELLEQMTNQQSVDLDELGVTELTELLGRVNMEAILQDFGRQKKGEDPVIHFYETFMRAYDPQQKTKRGEFYTPDAVVSFIVRSVDYLLRTEFDCADGVATPITQTSEVSETSEVFKPVFLDPATGTGTFLRYIVMVAWETFYQKYKKLSNAQRKEKWNQYVRASLLPRLYAFELKMSPYTIAHMKVGLTLQEFGFEFRDGERLQIYLTNALQPSHEVARVDTPALAHESEQANEVKNNAHVTVIVGNPPYSKFSSNTGQWISEILKSYYQVDGKPLGEKNPKWLQDDYVKFFRFGQWRIDQSGFGILAMITNHGYLNNPTFRGMRQQLMQSFTDIYILDLHGSSKKQEKSPDGSKEENVFDIQQGVAICLMVKRQNGQKYSKVFHSDMYGTRSSKYEKLLLGNISNIEWEEIQPISPSYLYIPQDSELLPEYNKGWSVTKIFPVFASTVTTARNDFSMSYSPDVLDKRIKDMQDSSIPDKTIREKYDLKDVSYWTLPKARRELSAITDRKKFIKPYCYRPFDFRYVYYHKAVCERLRTEVMSHMQDENIAFLTHRPQSPSDFTFAYCTKLIGDQNVAANKSAGGGNSFQFPLYTRYEIPDSSQTNMFSEGAVSWKANLNQNFLDEIKLRLNLQFKINGTGDLHKTFGPEDIFHYMYAIFHSPTYRSRYAEFLKIDFPRLPLTSNFELFRKLCGLGKELVALHLLEDKRLKKPDVKLMGEGDNVVAKGYPDYGDETVFISERQGFTGVSEDVWNFHIGGYQVCQKWLKDRRGRQLSAEDIVHYGKVVVALRETIRLMAEVDAVIDVNGGWPMM